MGDSPKRGHKSSGKIQRLSAESGESSSQPEPESAVVPVEAAAAPVPAPEAEAAPAPAPSSPSRNRGGFTAVEFNTIPENVSSRRAPKGSPGLEIKVLTNFVRIEQLPEGQIIKYRVDFEPNVESTRLRGLLFNQVSERHFQRKCIFDGMSDARSSISLANEETTTDLANPQEPGRQVAVIVKKVGIIENPFEMIRLYNMHMKQFLKALGFFSVSTTGAYVHHGREFLQHIGQDTGIVSLRGYRTSANVHEGSNMLMNFESVHKLMQQENVREYMWRNRSRRDFRNAIRADLTGKLVITRYNKIVYRIEDINFDLNPNSEFEDRRGGRISYARYYQERYNITIRDLDQPLLLAVQNNRRGRDQESGERRDCFLVPEICNITGLTDDQRNDRQLKMALIQASQIDPRDRVRQLRDFLRMFHGNDAVRSTLNQWRYQYGDDLTEITARNMPAQRICFQGNVGGPIDRWPQSDAKSGSFDQHVTRSRLAVSPQCGKIAVLISPSDAARAEHIWSGIAQGFSRVGLNIPENSIGRFRTEGDNAQAYAQKLRQVADEASAAVIILPNQNKEKYDAVKKLASVDKGLITQVVTSKLMLDERKRIGAGTKIAIQLAAKLGGEPWLLEIPITGLMVCGYDTYHDTARRGRSYGAFVASMNDQVSRWWSKADSHDHLDELSSHMAQNLRAALEKYKELNKGKCPNRLVIYRDGVSDGQLAHVFNVELSSVRKVIEEIDDGIRLAFIVVNKRIGARFYWKHGSDFFNCPPGTVIDSTVTRRERYDFYLISQSTARGTVAPTYYNIIFDETGLDASKHQALAFKMCFAYYNWSGTVKVPAPCQYAHKLALLCGEHLHNVPNALLDDRLHFL